MEDNILILPVDPETFAIQSYSQEDVDIISTTELDTAFSSSTDYIEYYVYDENQNKIFPPNTQELITYNIKDGNVNLDPTQDLQRQDFNEGDYYINYYFYRKHLNSSPQSKYYISEISADRTEIRLASSVIENEDIVSSTNEFISYRNSKDYFVDFYLNFGENNLAIANNIRLDTTVDDNPTILVKLYEALPQNYDLKSQCWVIENISTPQGYQVRFPIPIFEPSDFTFIAGPNYSLDIKNESGVNSEITTYNTLISSNLTSSTQQINSLLNEKGLKININYEDRSDYIKFSSALTRLENFYYKVGLVESYQNEIASLTTNITGSTTGSSAFSSSKASWQGKIDNIIDNLDGYEYFLYFNSGSKYSYPKSTSTKPYALQSTGSSEVLNWLGSANPSSPYYGGQALSSSNYDQENQDWLYWSIPDYLREDPENQKYELFVDMVGQHFDNIWLYSKDIVNKFDADNRLDYGISKDLVADAIKEFGVKLYSNNFNTNDLYEAFLGITPSGSYFPSTGSEHIDTMISASNDAIPLDDVNKLLYKRIYHNIPYLLKTKGTIAGLRALITSYGIPDTILRIDEFGDQNINISQNWELEQNVFNYKLDVDGSNYLSSSFQTNEEFGEYPTPKTIQFRFKAPGIPTGSVNQQLWSGEGNQSSIILSYTGSSQDSGSYSGSIVNPENEYGRVIFYPQGITVGAPTASVLLPLFDKGWWSVQTTVDFGGSNTASLYVANKSDHTVLHQATDSVGCNTDFYKNVNDSTFPAKVVLAGYERFSGSYQEIRYWGPVISQSSFDNFVLNPYSCVGNSINSTPDELAFRAALGTMLNTGSRNSIHPTFTGSSVTSSFEGYITDSWGEINENWDQVYSTWGDNADKQYNNFIISSASFSTNKELIYLNQVPVGIKNRISDKITLKDNIIPSGDTLSPLISLEQNSYTSQNSTSNTRYLEVAFSPTTQVDNDIISQLGNFNIGDYIGDPRQVSESKYNYPDLDTLRNAYFEKYSHSYDIKDFIRLIKYFDNSLFKMIKDFTPARTSLSSGVVVKQHILERNKQRSVNVSFRDEQLTASLKPFVQNYESGSVYHISGGAGGYFNKYNGLDYHPNGVDGTGASNRFGIEQTWTEYHTSRSGSIAYTRDDQREFYNGEFSGSSQRVKLQRGDGLDGENECDVYYTWNNIPQYEYRIVSLSGSDNEFLVTELTGGIPPAFTALDVNYQVTFSVDYLGIITPPTLSGTVFDGDISYHSASGGNSPYYELIGPDTASGLYRTSSFNVVVPNKPLSYSNYRQIIYVTASALQPTASLLTFDMITGSAENSASGFEVNVYGNITAPTIYTASLYGNVIYSESISNSYYPAITSSLVRTAHITASVPYGWFNSGSLISGSVTDTQEDLDIFYVYLGYSVSPSAACYNTNNRFRLDNVILKEATAVYRESEDSLGRIRFANSGYYSDGNIVRYWNGTQFTTLTRCSEYV